MGTVNRFVISRPRLKSFGLPTVKRDSRGIIRCLSCFRQECEARPSSLHDAEKISGVEFVDSVVRLSDNRVIG